MNFQPTPSRPSSLQGKGEKNFILASASPQRLDLLRQAGFAPDRIVPAELDETPLKGELPGAYVTRAARAKAKQVAQAHPQSVVLAADTAAACGRRILGKAEDEAQARRFLQCLSGRRHRVYTSVCLHHEGKARQRLVMTQLRLKRLSKQEIEAYIASGAWAGKAGGYGIQGACDVWVPWIGGSYSNIVGLPLYETALMLAQAGICPKQTL